MPASVHTLQIANQDTRERISGVIWSETSGLSHEYEVSIIDSRHNDIWELFVKRPDRSKVAIELHADQGDLTPAVVRIRLRKLLKSL